MPGPLQKEDGSVYNGDICAGSRSKAGMIAPGCCYAPARLTIVQYTLMMCPGTLSEGDCSKCHANAGPHACRPQL